MNKHLLPFLLGVLFSFGCFAQTPETISYQAVMRDASGLLLKETNVGVRFSVLRGSDNGPAVYVEEFSAVTNANGLLSLAVGGGASVGNASLADVDWSNGPYFLRCEVDPDGGHTYTLGLTTALTSVPYALYAETISPSALPAWVRSDEKPVYSYAELSDTPSLPTKLSDLENDMDFVTKADWTSATNVGSSSSSLVITASDTASWNRKLSGYTECDPAFGKSVAAGISSDDTASWNRKLSEYTESDPLYVKSVAAGITAADTASWNKKLDGYTESDPLYKNSPAAGIKASDIASWNAKLGSFTETDPLFGKSAAAGISAADVASWNATVTSVASWNTVLTNFEETDPAFKGSPAAGIKAADISSWNAKLSSYTETDPVYKKSVAAGIKAADTTAWNKKLSSETDPKFSASAAAQITAADIARWNTNASNSSSSSLTEESDPLFTASAAASIQQSDVAAWNAKANLSDVPTKVSAFTNDAQYVTMAQLSGIFSSLDSLSLENKRLRSKVMSMEPMVYGTVTYQRASTTTYPFSVDDFNYAPDIYHALREGDRVMFIVRHSERGTDYSETGPLNENGIVLAQQVGPRFKGGLAGVNDAFYGSTKVTRCKETSYYVASTRGDADPASINEVHAPIDHLNSNYLGVGDDNTAVKYYKNNPTTVDTKAKALINELCEMSAGKTFAWFTSHDYCMLPIVDWASDHGIVFTAPAKWINYMSGVAVIVHPNGSWEVYPVRNLDSGFMYRIY